MISRIDHISIAVKNYPEALHFFKDILGAAPGAGAQNNDMKYHWQIFSFGDLSRLELITPLEEETFLTNFLNKHAKTVVDKSVWRLDMLPDYYSLNIKVINEHGKLLQEGRDISLLKKSLIKHSENLTQSIEHPITQIKEKKQWDFGDLPENVQLEMHGKIFDVIGQPKPELPFSVILMVVLVFTIIGLLAGLLPAFKATKIDPVEALAHE